MAPTEFYSPFVQDDVDDDGAFERELIEVAELVLDQCRTRLMMSFRFMNRALWRMPRQAANLKATLASDGSTLFFDPYKVIMRFQFNPNEMARDYLHTLLHCVFRHPFDDTHFDGVVWTASCDVVIESIAMEMCDGHYVCAGDAGRKQAQKVMANAFDVLTPYKLYRTMVAAAGSMNYECAPGLKFRELARLSSLFARDDHSPWAQPEKPSGEGEGDSGEEEREAQDNAQRGAEGMPPDEDSNEEESEDAGSGENEEGEEQQEGMTATSEEDEADDSSEEVDQDEGNSPDEPDEDDPEAAWEAIGKQIETDLQTLSRRQGENAGTLMKNLAVSNRTQVNYDEFLRRFATMAEDMRINDEEFDYVFYTYGLKLYGNMPLVEPLEYKESRRVREFVVALDTSGSCERELVARFLMHTYEILKNTEQFGDEICVHIIQCDAAVQSDVVVRSIDELNKFAATFEVKGFGGTDYRPVFDYVGELIDDGEFDNLRGLVYFTDGYGTFPEVAPPYEVAFVFLEDDGQSVHVPPWAMKVIMGSDSIRDL